jgi:integrase
MSNQYLKPIHSSEVNKLCLDFLELKRATGLKYETEAKTLRQFSRYCEQNFLDCELPEDVVYNWISNATNQSLKTRSNKASTLIQWAQYLFSIGYMQLKLPWIRYSANTAFVPHVFTADEMKAIWNTVDNIQPSKTYPNRHLCIPVLFRLLYASGLRIYEALQITLRDIDFESNVITLRHTKLDRERLIPISKSMAQIMRSYAVEHEQELDVDSPFFYYRRGVPLVPGSVYGRFRITLHKSGIPYEGKLRGPRLHDLRHTFAVNAMNRLTEEGYDLYVILPILSTYLGHSSIKSTERYLRLTEERLSTIVDSVQTNIPDVFPEVIEDAEF